MYFYTHNRKSIMFTYPDNILLPGYGGGGGGGGDGYDYVYMHLRKPVCRLQHTR